MLDKSLYTSAPAYFHYYYDLVETNDLLQELVKNRTEVLLLLSQLSEEKMHRTYAAGKWTLAEVVRHVIDTERIFAYRAMRFSRFDATPLPGFDENQYIDNLREVRFSKMHLQREFECIRDSSLALFETTTPGQLHFEGNANGVPVTAEMIGYMIVGHTKHHLNIIRTRY